MAVITSILDLPTEMLHMIFSYLDGPNVLNCLEVFDSAESSRIKWQRYCRNEMKRTIYVDLLIKHDPKAKGLTNQEWAQIYLDWRDPRRLFKKQISKPRVLLTFNVIHSITTHGCLIYIQLPLVKYSNFGIFKCDYVNQVMPLLPYSSGSDLSRLYSVNNCPFTLEAYSLSNCPDFFPIRTKDGECVSLIRAGRANIPFGCCDPKYEKYACEYLQRDVSRTGLCTDNFRHTILKNENNMPTYFRQHGSVIIIGTDKGALYIFKETLEEDNNQFITSIMTERPNIKSIDVAWNSSSFDILYANDSNIGIVSFEL